MLYFALVIRFGTVLEGLGAIPGDRQGSFTAWGTGPCDWSWVCGARWVLGRASAARELSSAGTELNAINSTAIYLTG
jgi:hypothetical protein